MGDGAVSRRVALAVPGNPERARQGNFVRDDGQLELRAGRARDRREALCHRWSFYEMLWATRVEDRNDATVAAFMNSLQVVP